MILPPAKCLSKGPCRSPWSDEPIGDAANLDSKRECLCRREASKAEAEGASAAMAPPPTRKTGNCRAMTAVTAKWLDTRHKRSSRGIVGEIDPRNGSVCRRWKKLKLELAAEE